MNRQLVRLVVLLFATLGPQWGRAADPKNEQYGSEAQRQMTFYFAHSSSLLMRDYLTNQASFAKLDRILREPEIVSLLDSVVIMGGSSLIGSLQYNDALSRDRAEAVRNYIKWRHPQVPNGKIRTCWTAINWLELSQRVESDPSVPNRNEVLNIASLPIADESKLAQLELLGGGQAKTYIEQRYSRYMRSSLCIVFFLNTKSEELSPVQDKVDDSVEKSSQQAAESGQSPVAVAPDEPSETVASGSVVEVFSEKEPISLARKPLFALKTNLLFDAVSALNLELEVPIGRRWSVAVEGIFPWWLWEKEQYCLQVLSGNIEGRYWFGNRDKLPQLTGWFAGVYAGGGYYDIEWKERGYQGEFFLSAGLSGGYAHTINKAGTLRMEYSLGLGYMRTNYREYVPQFGLDNEWHLIRQQSGTFTWIGPTRAKVSLVWLIHHGYQKKGGLR